MINLEKPMNDRNGHPEKIELVFGYTRAMTNSGWSANYYPFGEIASQTGSPEDTRYDYTGQERDRGTGLMYFGARYYDPEIGRWLSVDPESISNLSMNPYNYCKNNSINRIDIDGQIDKKAVVKHSFKFLIDMGAIGLSLNTMIAAGGSEVYSAGGSSPVSIPAFFISYGYFTYYCFQAGTNITNIILAAQTPDGMKLNEFKMVREIINDILRNDSAAEAAQLIYDVMGLKGITGLGQNEVIRDLSILISNGSSAEDIINFLKALERQKKAQIPENNCLENSGFSDARNSKRSQNTVELSARWSAENQAPPR